MILHNLRIHHSGRHVHTKPFENRLHPAFCCRRRRNLANELDVAQCCCCGRCESESSRIVVCRGCETCQTICCTFWFQLRFVQFKVILNLIPQSLINSTAYVNNASNFEISKYSITKCMNQLSTRLKFKATETVSEEIAHRPNHQFIGRCTQISILYCFVNQIINACFS